MALLDDEVDHVLVAHHEAGSALEGQRQSRTGVAELCGNTIARRCQADWSVVANPEARDRLGQIGRDGQILRGEDRQPQKAAGEAGAGDPGLDARGRREDDDGPKYLRPSDCLQSLGSRESATATLQRAEAGSFSEAFKSTASSSVGGNLTQFLNGHWVEST